MRLSAHSFAIFVYPFCFERARFTDRVSVGDRDSLAVGDQAWPIWARRCFPRDDFLRHVADYLNPPPGMPTTACLWSLEERVLTSFNGLGLRVGALSLCLRHRCRVQDAAAAPVSVPEGALPLVVAGIDLALFGVGMGYL
ncbi:MAG: hypothetical protein ACFCVA_11415 [Gammaproteobacteria bacterium]